MHSHDYRSPTTNDPAAGCIPMLRHTFIHLPGVGIHRERSLWQQGILNWDGFLEAAEDGLLRKGIYAVAG